MPTTTGAAPAVAAAFALLSRMRGARVFHPHGVGYAATLRGERPPGSRPGASFLERGGEHPAVVRFSRGAGLPEPLPDVLGLAIRLIDVHGRGRHQDFLLVSSVDLPVLHHALVPAFGFLGQSFSSLLLYRVAGRLRLVGAQPMATPAGRHPRRALADLEATADRGDLRFGLGLAPLMGRWTRLAELTVTERLADDVTERLAFTPWNTGGAFRPAGPLMGIRRAAYRGSQRGRGLAPGEIP